MPLRNIAVRKWTLNFFSQHDAINVNDVTSVMETRRKKLNFWSLVNGMKLPRAQRCRGKLYSVTVLERNTTTDMVKVHYDGYGSEDDEWRPAAEIVEVRGRGTVPTPVPTFSLYQELAIKIKSSLISTRKGSPEVKIEMCFDKPLFDQGLKTRGILKRICRGIAYYTISSYSDLNDLLGDKWFIRGLNAAGDFCYVSLASISFCLKRRRALYEYVPDASSFNKQMYQQSYVVQFTFVRGNGISTDFQRMYSMQ